MLVFTTIHYDYCIVFLNMKLKHETNSKWLEVFDPIGFLEWKKQQWSSFSILIMTNQI